MKITPLLLLLLFSFNAQAIELSLMFGGYSHHLNSTYSSDESVLNCNEGICRYEEGKIKYNQDHDFIGFIYDNYIVAKFKNSLYRQSYLVAYNYELYQFENYFLGMQHTVSVMGGVVTGYQQDDIMTSINDNLAIYISPSLESRYVINSEYSVSINTNLVGTAIAVTASINYRFK